MASSGYKDVTVTNWDTLRFRWWVNSQSISNISTTIGWAMELIATSDGRINASSTCDWSVTVDGKSYSGSVNVGISNNTTKTLASGTTTISHDGDGSKTFSYSFSQHFGITFSGKYIGTVSGEGSGTLDEISSASQPSCITWPNHTQNVGEFGDTISIHMNRKSSSITHRVSYTFGDTQGLIATNVGTGTTWKIPLSLMDLIPNSLSGSGTIWVESYADGKQIGIRSCGFTATVPDSVKPTCTFTLEDITNIDDIYGSPVQNLSKIKITVNSTLAYSSPIESVRITANGVTYTTSPATTGVLLKSGTSTVTATVTDKRGRSGSVSYDMNVQAYSLPNISKLTVQRCNSDGSANDKGKYVKVTFSASVSSMNSTNTARYQLKYRKSTDTTFTTTSFSALNNKYSVTDQTYIFSADDGSSYVVEVVVTDKHNTSTKTNSASTGFTLMHFGADGKSIGVGKVSEKTNTMEVALDAEFHGSTIQKGNKYCFSTAGVAGSAGYILMASIEIKKANADTPITFVFCRRTEPCPMTVHVLFQSISTLTPNLTSIVYEGNNYGAFLVQSSASIWDLYVQKSSAYDTIALTSWATSHTMDDRISITFPGTLVSTVPNPFYRATPAKTQSLLDHIFPINSIYISYSHTSPAELFGGTWTRINNAFLWAADSSGTIGQTGGESTHTLTTSEIPSHNHLMQYSTNNGSSYTNASVGRYGDTNFTEDHYLGMSNTVEEFASYRVRVGMAGGGAAHNNMPPYIQVAVWRRTA